jgi:hypothetical protein
VEWKISQLANTYNIYGGSGISAQAGQNINTISLSSLNLNGHNPTVNFDNLEFEFNDNVKKYEVYEISQDLLALSVCWARYRKVKDDNKVRPAITKLLDSDLFRLVSEDDIAQANIIRDYYSKKIMVLKLKNEGFTSFREDLNTFIHSDGKMFKENMMPLAYRLPEFYEYDVEFEKMSFDFNREVKRMDQPYMVDTKQLTFVKHLLVNKKRYKRKEYWFSDRSNNLVNIDIDTSNPLISLMDLVVSKTDITINGRFKKCTRDGNEFIKVNNKFTFV